MTRRQVDARIVKIEAEASRLRLQLTGVNPPLPTYLCETILTRLKVSETIVKALWDMRVRLEG